MGNGDRLEEFSIDKTELVVLEGSFSKIFIPIFQEKIVRRGDDNIEIFYSHICIYTTLLFDLFFSHVMNILYPVIPSESNDQ